ncbi:NAD(P)-binding oxidoreductase [Arthrobacter sp. NPDC093128]|uniref:NAD(P)-binding oxidoreductase n=1 Tax=Arthrobacter sp. NPDC093128 TaxID=3154979 RepID=UPI0034417AA1
MNIFLIGAAGGVGRRLIPLLVAKGDDVTGMHRAEAQADTIQRAGAAPLAGDLISDSVEGLARNMRGHDAVVFSAGAHGTGIDQTTLIDGKGLEKAATAAEEAGVPRFLLVSGFPEAGRQNDVNESFEHFKRVKKAADAYLARRRLDWIILRPGPLLDQPGSGCVSAGPALEFGPVPREDVAAFIAATLHESGMSRLIIELTAGATPIGQAVAHLARAREPRGPLLGADHLTADRTQ